MGKTIRNNVVAKHSEKFNKPKTIRDKKKDYYRPDVQREMGRTITTVRSDEDSGEEKQGKWGKLSELIW